MSAITHAVETAASFFSGPDRRRQAEEAAPAIIRAFLLGVTCDEPNYALYKSNRHV